MNRRLNRFKHYNTTTQKEETLNFTSIMTALKILLLRGNIRP